MAAAPTLANDALVAAQPDNHVSPHNSPPTSPSMVQQRSRRANAGNRMRSLLEAAGSDQQAQGDEWYNHEAFAEDAEDEEFGGFDPEDTQAANDELVSSSSEDEDPQDHDEDAGENALQKEERKQKLKRKRPGLLEQAAMKKAKVATAKAAASDAGAMAPPPKPKKKSERVSWLPVEADGPVRASSRNLTLQNKQNVANSLQQKEANRIRILKMMEASNVRKERDKPQGPITQEERLAEAAKVERQNAKTVSRWEESERQREEEQRARLEALKNRKLDGPFIRYYSGPSIWVNDKLKGIGAKKCRDEHVDASGRRNSHHSRLENLKDEENPDPSNNHSIPHETDAMTSELPATHAADLSRQPDMSTPASEPTHSHDPLSQLDITKTPDPTLPNIMFPQPRPSYGFLDGIEDWAGFTNSHDLNPPHRPTDEPALTKPVPQEPVLHDTTDIPQSHPPGSNLLPQTGTPVDPVVPDDIQTITIAVRNLLTVHNVPHLKPRDRDALTRAIFPHSISSLPVHNSKPSSRGATRGTKSSAHNQELCTITSLPARYRDPATGLVYHDAYAYKCLRRFVDQGTAGWSELLGCFVGPRGNGRWSRASGVPAGWFGDSTCENIGEEVSESVGGQVKLEH